VKKSLTSLSKDEVAMLEGAGAADCCASDGRKVDPASMPNIESQIPNLLMQVPKVLYAMVDAEFTASPWQGEMSIANRFFSIP
jgi:hypothetical protein